jgi:hypothetical protein
MPLSLLRRLSLRRFLVVLKLNVYFFLSLIKLKLFPGFRLTRRGFMLKKSEIWIWALIERQTAARKQETSEHSVNIRPSGESMVCSPTNRQLDRILHYIIHR